MNDLEQLLYEYIKKKRPYKFKNIRDIKITSVLHNSSWVIEYKRDKMYSNEPEIVNEIETIISMELFVFLNNKINRNRK
jgi:hypothetical protein